MSFKSELESLDDFLNGRVQVFQSKSGFRAGTDSVLLAAAISPNTKRILELGCGAGVATCCALADRPNADALLIDCQAEAVNYAVRNLEKNGFSARAQTMLLDVTAKGSVRSAAGLKADYFSTIIANPPFFVEKQSTASPEKSRLRARQMPEGELDNWVKTAAASAAPKGEIIFIHTISELPELLASFEKRFGDIKLLPIAPRPKKTASRILIRGIKGSRAPLSLLPSFILHGEQGREFSPAAEAIFRGGHRLHW